MNLRTRHLVFLLLIAFGLTTSVSAQESDLVILPVANHTGLAAAQAELEPILEQALAARGWRLLTSGELRPVLREFRIRSRGWIGSEAAKRVSDHTGARYLLLGSWDIFRQGEHPEVGFSLRLLDTATMTLVKAVSCGTTGEDQVGWLGLGKVTSCGELARRLLDQALIGWSPRDIAAAPAAAGPTVVLVPLDNFSTTENAGAVLDGVLVSGLVQRGYHVVEPGFVREVAIARESYLVGGLDRATSAALQATFGANLVLTGAVDRFAPAAGDPHVSAPHVACGLRAIDPGQGLVRLAREIDLAGDKHDGLFQAGRINGLIPLTESALNMFINDLKFLESEESNRDE